MDEVVAAVKTPNWFSKVKSEVPLPEPQAEPVACTSPTLVTCKQLVPEFPRPEITRFEVDAVPMMAMFVVVAFVVVVFPKMLPPVNVLVVYVFGIVVDASMK